MVVSNSSTPSPPTPKTTSEYSLSPPRNTTKKNNSTSHQGNATPSYIYHPVNYERSMNEGTVYGRLANANSESLATPFVYSRIPIYCIRATRVIDEFESAFDKSADK